MIDECGSFAIHLHKCKSIHLVSVAGVPKKVGKLQCHEARHVGRCRNLIRSIRPYQDSDFRRWLFAAKLPAACHVGKDRRPFDETLTPLRVGRAVGQRTDGEVARLIDDASP